jgi:hypothetical protein
MLTRIAQHTHARVDRRPSGRGRPGRVLSSVWLLVFCGPSALPALPSFARQTGEKCAACHVSGSWPQLTPWGRFFKLSGYTAGKPMVDKEGFHYVPTGVLGQLGLTAANQANNSLGQPVIRHNGSPEAYAFTGEVATRLTDFMGVSYEYEIGNQFPGWKGSAGPVDIRAVHFFHPGGNELLVGIDSNNSPSVQDVWNSTPVWSYPFSLSPQAPGGGSSPMIARLGEQSGSVGAYAVLNREWYAEVSVYRAGTDFFRWMNAGTAFQTGDKNYLSGSNPYWRAYWTNEEGPHSFMAGTFGMQANVFPNSAAPNGPGNTFTDYGFDSQYQYLGASQKVTLRGSYTYERQHWNASFASGDSSILRGNIKSLNLNGTYGYRDQWVFNGGYFLNNGSDNAALFSVTGPSGVRLSSSPDTSGYVAELDRIITQNLRLTLQYKGFLKVNGLTNNIDGLGRSASANNTVWLTMFFAF